MIAVLIGNRSALREEDHRQLQRVARGGLACGIQLVLLDVPVTLHAAVETVRIGDDEQAQTSMTGEHVRVEPEPPRPLGEVTDACHAIAEEYDDWRSRIALFARPDPGRGRGAESSKPGLLAPVGFGDGGLVSIELDDSSPHALIGGPSGSGKTNLLLTMISSLAARYSPDEVEFYLLDFKEGVSFAQFAPDRQRETWLPHARLIGVNINTDREFGLALLQFLSDEMRRRAAAAKALGVTKLEELRDGRPGGALAADRRRDRRVPVPVRRERRGDQGGRAAAGGRGPARPLAGHPPGAGQPGHLRDPGLLGPPGGVRAVRAADRAAPGAPGAGGHQRRRGRPAALARGDQPRVRDQARQRRSCGSRTPRPRAWSSGCSSGCSRSTAGRRARGCSTAAAPRASRTWSRTCRPATTSCRGPCSASASTSPAGPRWCGCRPRRAATSGCSPRWARTRCRCSTAAAVSLAGQYRRTALRIVIAPLVAEADSPAELAGQAVRRRRHTRRARCRWRACRRRRGAGRGRHRAG